eukprot:symbB.v1.2.029174.t1/scaffold3166.1/size62104/1
MFLFSGLQFSLAGSGVLQADALFQGLTRVYLFEIFKTLRPRLKIRQLDEEREPLPEMIPTQFIFAAATYVHVGPFSEGNM